MMYIYRSTYNTLNSPSPHSMVVLCMYIYRFENQRVSGACMDVYITHYNSFMHECDVRVEMLAKSVYSEYQCVCHTTYTRVALVSRGNLSCNT